MDWKIIEADIARLEAALADATTDQERRRLNGLLQTKMKLLSLSAGRPATEADDRRIDDI